MNEITRLECLKLAFSINPVATAAELVENAKVLLAFVTADRRKPILPEEYLRSLGPKPTEFENGLLG